MTFVATNDRSNELNELAAALLQAFPGSAVYKCVDPLQTAECLSGHRVDAVFIEAEMESASGVGVLCDLRASYPEVPVFLLSDDDGCEGDALWNEATGYLIRPITADNLREALKI